jgi:feruloyl esterase
LRGSLRNIEIFNEEKTMLMRVLLTAAAACALSGLGLLSSWAAEDNSVTPTAAECKALASTDFSGVQDAPTQITEAGSVEASDALPGYCRVTGYVAAQVGIKLALPESWNGKLIEMGCGGHCGTLSDERLSANCGEALPKGYACIISDTGHKGTGGDGLWAYNNLQAIVDWAYRAPHVTALAGKAITQSFYKKPPAHSYFSGCSTGGRQALQEAQRFPWDFDGIIAGAPPIRLADLYVTFAWGQRAAHDAAGKPLLSIADLKLLTDGALARCDLDDGIRDGIISNPFTCPFRAADLACKKGQTTGCLTPEKVQAADKIYSGPVDAAGHSLFGAGAAPGSELGEPELEKSGGDWGIYYLGTDQAPAAYADLTQEGLKYLFFSPAQSASWTIRQFDFAKDYKRLDVMQSLYDSSNPDLNRFKNAGGRMLIYGGLNDLSILPQWVISYYQNVERVMGGRQQTQDFVRLYSLPGVEHCTGGPGADRVDYLTYLENWVERGNAPEKLVAAHLKKVDRTHPPSFPLDPVLVQFTRPVYPYPTRAKYLGHGDPNDAASFGPTDH